MIRATWNGAVLAESAHTKVVEGNHYFPPESVKKEHFQESDATSVCGWKGTANYYDVVVDGEVNPQAAWFYASPKSDASDIAGFVAFWKGVEVTGEAASGDDFGEGKTCSL